MFWLREKKGRAGREQKETTQPCLLREAGEQLLGERWGLLSRMDVMGAPPAKPTVISMQARLGLHTHPLRLFGPDGIRSIFW